MNVSYLSLGSNMGDRLSLLEQAVIRLAAHPEIEVESISSVYETDPVGFTDQDAFLNIVLEVKTTLIAQDLLTVCQEIEQSLQRERIIRWGPRTIDLDILLFNQDNIETERLAIPHPRMRERAFVLIPLLEIAPQFSARFPTEDEGVRLWGTINND